MKYSLTLTEFTTFEDAVRALDHGGIGFLALLDGIGQLLGILTDGDIRRAFLSQKTNLREIINPKPKTLDYRLPQEQVVHLLKKMHRKHMPLVDENNIYHGVVALDLLDFDKKPNWVVIMAGGMGSRLRPLTDNCPKPMLKIGGKPILEILINNFIERGFTQFFLSVNYKAEVIRDYFGDGSAWGCEIKYLHEDQPLGTAGSLSLLPQSTEHPLIVINGDVLTKIDYTHLLTFHHEHNAKATMCVREYGLQVPYGVVVADDHRFVSIEEKPVHKFFINAGIYVLSPDVLAMLTPGEHCDMPRLLNQVAKNEQETAVFPVREYWMDLGQIEDFNRAKGEYEGVFCCFKE